LPEFTTQRTDTHAEVALGPRVVAAYPNTPIGAGDFGGVCAQALARSLNEGKGTPYAELPETCYGVKPDDESLILLKRGERGFWPAEGYPLGALPDTGVQADYLNARRGVTPAQRNAMEFGSMFGFDVPGANPAKYGPDGRLQR